MIPVIRQPEPANFDREVRQPGIRFLSQNTHPTEWKNRDFWRNALPDMRLSYNSICAYCATWIPYSTGSHSIDHFVPKAQAPNLAYEWDNFRYVSARFNSRKGLRSILDPFELTPDWFFLDLSSFLVKPNPGLSSTDTELVGQTIFVLDLNDEDLVNERLTYFADYRGGHVTFAHLQRRAPFIAYEIMRQGYI